MFLIVYYLIASALAATCSGSDNKCAEGQCDVTIGGQKYCSQCEATHVPINGKCVEKSGGANADKCKTPTGGKCTSCGDGYFLYKGGCYDKATPPGSTICTKQTAAGVCETCNAATGYFKNPVENIDATHQSCIACNETTAVDNVKGVEGCTACSGPDSAGSQGAPTVATCTKCTTNYLKKKADGSTECVAEDQCDVSGNAYYKVDDSSNGKKCVSCSDAAGITDAAGETWKGITGCAKCTKPNTAGAATCTECASNYLKIEGKTTSCVDANACTGGFVPTTDSSGKKVCVKCGDKTNGGIADCSACTPIESPTTTVLVKCSACSQGKVSPGGSSCMINCPENSTDNKGACICNNGFAPSGEACVSSSANRSGLSTGAIAGISVAAVVVVGGLVGFLCWWFVCRGKA